MREKERERGRRGGEREGERLLLPWQPVEVDSPTCPMTSAPSYSSKLALEAKCLPPPAGQHFTHRGDQCRPQCRQGLQPLPTSQGIHPRNLLLYKWDHGRIGMTMEPQVPPMHLSWDFCATGAVRPL